MTLSIQEALRNLLAATELNLDDLEPSTVQAIGEARKALATESIFEVEHLPDDSPDRVYVRVDGKFDVVVIRNPDGVVIDVYPEGWDAPLETFTVWDDDVVMAESGAA